MFIYKLKITGNPKLPAQFFEDMDLYLNLLNRGKQVINEEWQYEPIENGIQLNLYCPEKDSLNDKYLSGYGRDLKKKIEDNFKVLFKPEYAGIDPEIPSTPIPSESKFYILGGGEWSPLLDGETLESVPIYRIPFINYDTESYDDFYFWERNYKNIEDTWLIGGVGENQAKNQLRNFYSELNRQGMTIRKKIEELTSIPTYYFLFNYRAWGKIKDKKRKCPGCGADWLIEGKTINDFYAFKCDRCRLVSGLSSYK